MNSDFELANNNALEKPVRIRPAPQEPQCDTSHLTQSLGTQTAASSHPLCPHGAQHRRENRDSNHTLAYGVGSCPHDVHATSTTNTLPPRTLHLLRSQLDRVPSASQRPSLCTALPLFYLHSPPVPWIAPPPHCSLASNFVFDLDTLARSPHAAVSFSFIGQFSSKAFYLSNTTCYHDCMFRLGLVIYCCEGFPSASANVMERRELSK